MEIEPNKLANFLSATYEYQKDINLYFLHFEGKLK